MIHLASGKQMILTVQDDISFSVAGLVPTGFLTCPLTSNIESPPKGNLIVARPGLDPLPESKGNKGNPGRQTVKHTYIAKYGNERLAEKVDNQANETI